MTLSLCFKIYIVSLSKTPNDCLTTFKAPVDEDLPVNVETLTSSTVESDSAVVAEAPSPSTSEVKKKQRRRRRKLPILEGLVESLTLPQDRAIEDEKAGELIQQDSTRHDEGNSSQITVAVDVAIPHIAHSDQETNIPCSVAPGGFGTSPVIEAEFSEELEPTELKLVETPSLPKAEIQRESIVTMSAENPAQNTPVTKYSHFDFLANSIIITDVTTEQGTITVKECSAYEGFF